MPAGAPMIIATRDIKRPKPENNATETNSLPAIPDEVVEAGIAAEMRAALVISGSPSKCAIKIPPHKRSLCAATKVQCNGRVPQNSSTADGAGPHDGDAGIGQSR